jgi:hypothetical protein
MRSLEGETPSSRIVFVRRLLVRLAPFRADRNGASPNASRAQSGRRATAVPASSPSSLLEGETPSSRTAYRNRILVAKSRVEPLRLLTHEHLLTRFGGSAQFV